MPTAHELHALVPTPLYLPAGQMLQFIDSNDKVLCMPAWHGSHCDDELLWANLPPSHCLHSDALAPAYLPAGQASHAGSPVAFWCLPSLHASQ